MLSTSTLAAPSPAQRILLVEDQPAVRFAVRDLFSGKGLLVNSATDIAEARQLLARRSYPLVIIAVDPDGPCGAEQRRFTRELKASWPEMRIVVLSGSRVDPTRQRDDLGADAVLPKPAEMSELLAVVQRNLQLDVRPRRTTGEMRVVRRKILLVDDSSTALMAARMVLTGLPLDVVTACNGEEAVAKALREMPDLILMDVIMPKMTGFEACRAIRARPETQAIPIILVTTRGEPENVEQGYIAGCTDYVTKPINRLELLAKLKCHVGELGAP